MKGAEELRQELQNITGEVYVQLDNIYCPMCGEKINRKKVERKNER